MANLTRIQNNQIYDSTINAQSKIASGSITGNLLATNLTLNSNVTILGNLQVANSYTQLNSVNTYINDPIVVFNNGYVGSIAGYDIGILVNRNSTSLTGYSGGVNTFLGWSEAESAFVSLVTTETGTTVSSINNSGYANLHVGQFTAAFGAQITNNLTAGSITATPISGGAGSFSYLTATTGLSTSNAAITGGDVNGLTTLAATTAVVTNFSSANIQASSVSAGYITATTGLSTSNAAITGGSITGTPISTSTGSFTYLTATTGLSTGNALITGGDINGLTTLAAGKAVVTNFSSGNIQASSVSAGYITATTGLSTSNAAITGGDINGLTTLQATTAQFTNLSSGNITGTFYGITNGTSTAANVAFFVQERNATDSSTYYPQFGNVAGANAAVFTNASLTFNPSTGVLNATNFAGTGSFTTEVATNFSTGNALITGGDVNGLTTLAAGKAVVTNFSSGNTRITSGYADNFAIGANTAATGAFTTLATSANISLGGAIIPTADLTYSLGDSTHRFKSLYVGGSTIYIGDSTITVNTDGNLVLTTSGGGIFNIAASTSANNIFNANVQAPWVVGAIDGTTVNAATLNVSKATIATEVTTNFSTGNALITGGDVNGLTTLAAGKAVVTNFSSGNIVVTNSSVTTEVATNFSTGNAVITGGSLNNTTIGASTASTGKFTTIQSSDGTNATALGTGALIVTNGGASVYQDLWVGGNIYAGNLISQTNSILEVIDPLVYLTASNPASYDYEIGFYSHFIGQGPFSHYQHTGFVRNHVDSEWYLFSNIGLEPSGGTVNLSNVNIVYDTLNLGDLLLQNTTPSTSTTTGALIVKGGAGIAGQVWVGGLNATSGQIGTLNTTNFSSGNAVITGGSISGVTIPSLGTVYVTNLSSANVLITGGDINGLTTLQATTAQATNFSSGNIVVTNSSVTTEVATNFSTGNAVITGGKGSFGTLTATTGFSTGNALITGGDVNSLTTLQATTAQATNFSSGNAVISGGSVNGLTTLQATTAQATNFSSGNAVISGGSVNGLSTLSATTATATNFSSGNAVVTNGSFTTLVATNLSSGNVVFTGGYAQGLGNVRATEGYFTNLSTGNLYGVVDLTITNLTATTEVATNFSTGNALITGGTGSFGTLTATTGFSTGNLRVTGGDVNGLTTLQATTAQVTNFSSGNAVISGGSLNNTTIGATTANSGKFTTLTASQTIIASGNIVAASSTASTNETTGALVVKGGMGISGKIYSTDDINTTGAFITSYGVDLTEGGYVKFDNADTSAYYEAINTGSTTGVNRLIITNDGTTENFVFNNTGDFIVNSNDQATAAGAGALQVPNGGIYTGGNLVVTKSAFFNNGKNSNYDVITRGASDDTLIWARPNTSYDSVVIGGSATTATLVTGAKLIVNSTDSILLPVGTSSQRPSALSGGSDVTGMLRYSTTRGTVEFYDGAAWQSTTNTFTIIVEQQFTGTGSQTDFTLSQAATTASVIVSINGVIQIGGAGYAYTVSGTTLSFSEAPSGTDIIDVRILTTTQTVRGIASDNGYNGIHTDNTSVYLSTGTGSAVTVRSWLTNGAEVNSTTAVTALTTTTIDTFDATLYSSAEYTVTATDGSGLRTISKFLVAAGASSGAYLSTITTIDSSGATTVPGTYSVTNASGSVAVKFTPTVGSYSMRVKATYQTV